MFLQIVHYLGMQYTSAVPVDFSPMYHDDLY